MGNTEASSNQLKNFTKDYTQLRKNFDPDIGRSVEVYQSNNKLDDLIIVLTQEFTEDQTDHYKDLKAQIT